MTDLTIGADVNVWGGNSLNLELHQIRTEIGTLERRAPRHTFLTLAQLGLPETANLTQIAERMPQNSLLVIDVYGGTHGPTMPLPYFNYVGAPSYMSGIVTAYRGNDTSKVYFEWRNEFMQAYTSQNEFNQPNVYPWRIVPNAYMNRSGAGPGYWANKIGNIWVPGTYYFTTANMTAFTDSPINQGGYLTVTNHEYSPTSQSRMYKFVQNNLYMKEWVRQNDNVWVTVPRLHPTPVSDAELRIGDMKVAANGRVHMRVSATNVGQLTYVGEPEVTQESL